jgi:tRNA modification GTPase
MHRGAAANFVSERPNGETIAAISTAVGEGAIALIRISGGAAVEIAGRIFRGKSRPADFPSHTQHLGRIVFDGSPIDQAMIAVHRAPASYTGEDLVEISCHGGMLASAKVLEACLQAGARAARPGEFTERAYFNRKIDVTQAEAVIDVIRAQTDLALRSATEQLSGRLGQQFRDLRQEIIETLAHVEAAIDFPEEGISPNSVEVVRDRLVSVLARIQDLLATAETGRILREGLRVVIFGPTNAGKSSLLNRLLGFDRAIVSDIHGTTRDTIEEPIHLRGIALRLLDTAGFRQPENQIEKEGIMRTQRTLATADVRLRVLDASVARPPDFETTTDDLLILNKSDLPEHEDWKSTTAIRISCKTGAGLDKLESEIFRRIGGEKLNAAHPLAINARHRVHLQRAAAACDRTIRAINDRATPEMFAADLGKALRMFDELLGGGDEEAVRDAIFSQFCIGK